MNILTTSLEGVRVIEASPRGDERGYLVRTYCERAFVEAGLNINWVQHSLTHTAVAGSLRGMHLQSPPHSEIKLIRCVAGRVWDCLVDLRKGSPTHGCWEAFELGAENERALYVPEGIAHGFYTLTPDVRMYYQMSAEYAADHATGVRWNDPGLAIAWPGIPTVVSEKDSALPLFADL